MANDVRFSGPLFDGRAQSAVREYTEELEAELADEGKDLVVKYLGQFLQHPTGYYVSRVRVEQRGTAHLVTDSGVVYGPWLAGVGSRNQTTRFKGYRHWRLASHELEEGAEHTAARIFPRYLRRMS